MKLHVFQYQLFHLRLRNVSIEILYTRLQREKENQSSMWTLSLSSFHAVRHFSLFRAIIIVPSCTRESLIVDIFMETESGFRGEMLVQEAEFRSSSRDMNGTQEIATFINC